MQKVDIQEKIELIEQVISSALVPTAICNEQGQVLGMNNAFVQLTGRSHSDWSGLKVDSWFTVLTPTEESLEQLIRFDTPFEVRPINEPISSTFVVSPQYLFPDQKNRLVLLRFHESRQKQGYLEELRKLSLSASQSLSSILLVDTELVILWNNSQFHRKFNPVNTELIGKTIFDIVAFNDHNRGVLDRGIKTVKESGNAVQLELEPDSNQEEPCWYSLDISPAYNDDKELIHFILMLRDISQIKEAEHNLSLHQQRLKRAQQLAKLGEFEFDVKSQKTYWSDTLIKLLELEPKQLNSLDDFSKLLEDGEKCVWAEALQRTLDNAEQQHFHLNYTLPDGEILNLMVNLSLEKKDNRLFLLGTLEDVTELEEAKSKLEQALLKAEESARVKQEFLANMSHEIRTPMNSILGFSRLMLRSQQLNPEFTEFAQAIYESAEKLHIVLDEILNVARLESSDLTLDRHHIRSNDFIASLQKLHERKAREKGLTLELVLDSDFPEVMLTDHVRVFQVLSNLLDNAIKFTDEGKIRISAKALRNTPEGFVACFIVKDTGIGISKEAIQEIFESFKQADSSISRRYEGAGLGLSIVRRLIRLLNGTISVKSEPWEGSEFILEIPMLHGDPEQIVGPYEDGDEAAKQLEGLRVLLVEDNRNNRLLAQKFLNDLGMKSDEALNGIQAIGKVREHNYDFILMDIQMPEMDGIEATKLIRKMPGVMSQVPIIALTAHVLKDEIDSYQKVGMNAVINKPLKKGELIATMLNLKSDPNQTPEFETSTTDNSNDSDYTTINLKGLLAISRGDLDFIQEMIEAYFDDMPVYLSEFKSAFHAKDISLLGKMAHKMKSPLNIVGITAIDGKLDYLENLPGEDNLDAEVWTDLETTVQQIEETITKGSEELEDYRENTLNSN
ncbi:response regulator [bacterium SCSIO 12741]|nr:response regulator [bacterium SCSIO 12741]